MGSTSRPGRQGSYDALLLLSFGGPEGPDDVIEFLQNVTAGRGVPVERLEQVGAHYQHFGGVSPLNAQNRALLAAIRAELAAHGPDLPVYWGNRNWHPLLTDTVARMAEDGVRRAVVFVTSAYASYSGCRQYRENLADAAAACADSGLDPPSFDKLRHYFNHPGFVQPMVDATLAALAELDASSRDLARLVFVTHSIPTVMNATSGPHGAAYLSQHEQVCALVAGGVEARTGLAHDYDLVFCSRSGPAAQPWLGPDVNDHLAQLAAEGTAAVALVPIGFTSDHMEVRWDLDTEAAATARRLGLPTVRAGTVGTDPRFVAMVRELLVERVANTPADERAALGTPDHDVCPAGCCPNPRGPRPALAGADASMGEW